MSVGAKCLICEDGETRETPLCDSCSEKNKAKEIEEIKKIEGLVKKDKDISAEMIVEKTGIPYNVVKWYFNDWDIILSKKRVIDKGDKSGISIVALRYDKYVWIRLGGKIDSQNALALQNYLDDLIGDGWKHIILEMHEVKFFSSNGIRAVLATYKRLYDDGCLRIAYPSQNVANVLGMVALDQMLLK